MKAPHNMHNMQKNTHVHRSHKKVLAFSVFSVWFTSEDLGDLVGSYLVTQADIYCGASFLDKQHQAIKSTVMFTGKCGSQNKFTSA